MVEPILSKHDASKSKTKLDGKDLSNHQISDQDTRLNEGQLKQSYCPYCNSNPTNNRLLSEGVNLNTSSACMLAVKRQSDLKSSRDRMKSSSFINALPAKLIRKFEIVNLNCSNYSFTTLGCFFFNVIITCFYSTKAVMYSILLVDNQNPNEQVAISTKNQAANTDDKNYLSGLIYEFIFCDIFQQFTNRRTINLIAASLLLPSTINRLWCLFKLLRKIVTCNKTDAVSVEQIKGQRRYSYGGSKDFDSNNNDLDKGSKKVELNDEQTINVVQLNVAYLDSLQTTTSGWIELFKDGWHHVHPLQKFDKETNLSIKICLSKGILPSCINLRTKMYSYNMIQFNECYSKYFKPTMSAIDFDHKCNSRFNAIEKLSNNDDIDTDENKTDNSFIQFEKDQRMSSDLTTIMNSCGCIKYCAHLTTLEPGDLYDPLTKNLLLNEGKHRLDNVNEIDFDLKMLNIGNNEKKSQSFVARPIHRLDLNDMAWLVALTMLLYWSFFFNTFVPCVLAIIIETNISQISNHMTWSDLIVRWSQTATLQLLFVLTTFDLYNFVSSCLICISRARYVRLHLKNLKELCVTIRYENLIKSMNNNEKEKEENNSYERENDYFMDQLKQLENVEESGITMKLIDKFKDHFHDKQISVEDIQLHDLNRRLEILIDRSLLVQRELYDLKNFFTVYLDFEIASKVLCSAFSLSALLDQRNTFELLYIFLNTLTGATPIIITLTMAAFVEHEFRKICKEMSQLLTNGTDLLTIKNIRQLMVQSSHLSVKSNRSITIVGNFSLSMGSLISVIGWVATSLVLFRR